MPRLLTGLLIFSVAFITFELSINGVWQTDHSISFVQLDYAIWHDHSLALTFATKVPPWTVDNFVHDGQNYSALAPGAAFLALPFTGLGFTLAGGYTAFGPILLLSETFVSLMGAVSACLLYALASLYFRPSTSVLLAFAFAFSTTVWPMATYFFQSDVSAALVLLSAYLAVRAVRAKGGSSTLASFSGLAAAVAFTVDYINGALLAVVLGFLIAGRRKPGDLSRTFAGFVLGALPGLAAIGAYNYSIFGSPLVTTEQTYQGAASVFSSFNTSPAYGLALDLFSPARGLLVFAPFLMLGVVGNIDALRNRAFKLEMWFFLSVFLVVLLPYSMWYEPFGGLSFGPRFLVAAIPFLLLPAGFVVERAKGWKSIIVYGPFLAGVVMNGAAAVVTAIPVTKGFNDSPFTSVIVPRFLAGSFDAAWGSLSPYPWLWGALLVGGLGAAAPIAIVILVRRREGKLGAAPPFEPSK